MIRFRPLTLSAHPAPTRPAARRAFLQTACPPRPAPAAGRRPRASRLRAGAPAPPPLGAPAPSVGSGGTGAGAAPRLLLLPVLGLLVALAALVPPSPAAAQFGGGIVKDPWNLIENAASAANTYQTVLRLRDQIERMDRDLEAWERLFRRDRRAYFVWLNELAAQGKPWSYSVPEVYALYKQAVPPLLAFTPEVLEEIDVAGLYEIWQGSAIDTFAATLASAAQQGAAQLGSEEDRVELERALAASGGNLEALQAVGMIDLHVAQEISRLNQLLASVVSNQSAFYGHRLTTLGATEATSRYLLEAELELLPAAGTVEPYDDASGFTGLPPGLNR